MNKVIEIEQTCSACPAQWEGVLEDGRAIYIRYRWGHLSIEAGKTVEDAIRDGDTLLSTSLGDGLDGILSYEELKEVTQGVLEWN